MTLKRIAVCIVCLLFASTGSEITAARPDTNGGDEEAEYRTQPTGANDFVIGGGYYEYYLNHQSKPVASSQILLVPDPERTLEGIDCAVADPSIEWEIEVPETGKYNIMIEYYPLPGTGKDIELKIYINGKTPYNELAVFSLPRAWRDARDENGVSILQDRLGNDIRPAQVERFRWNSAWISDRMGLYGDPFYVYLEKGTHTFSLHRVRELVAIKSVLIAARPEPMSHDEYMRKNSDAKAG
ncbi:MAG: hypothetical protein FWF03_06935, partial [Defluviitaleaceae bacterium]|nr:hypothetical protein [Defluviitaleaceae bacterium]